MQQLPEQLPSAKLPRLPYKSPPVLSQLGSCAGRPRYSKQLPSKTTTPATQIATCAFSAG